MKDKTQLHPSLQGHWAKKAAPLLVILLVGVVVYSLFYYSEVKEIKNTLATETSGVALHEIFNENDQWLVGETKEKVVSFENTDLTEQVIRFTITEAWAGADGASFTDSANAATINWTEYLEDEWTAIIAEDGTVYYYYNDILAVGETTNPVMGSVSFSEEISNGGYQATVVDYSGKVYTLTITMEALPVSEQAAQSSWGVSFTQAEDSTLSWAAWPQPTRA